MEKEIIKVDMVKEPFKCIYNPKYGNNTVKKNRLGGLYMGEMKIKQIIVVTDGKSNIGGDPVMAARQARKNNIVVSVIGITGRNESDESPIEEIKNIAEVAEGEWELTYIENLSATLQMMTQKTVSRTLSAVVNKELKEIIGTELKDIEPKSRSKLIEYIDKISDEINLKCCILMDCSGSMKTKLKKARESILDLMNSLQSRKGKSEISVIAFPGKNGEMTDVLNGFTDDMALVKNKIRDINARGTTPTAPAIYRAIELLTGKNIETYEIIEDEKPLMGENIV